MNHDGSRPAGFGPVNSHDVIQTNLQDRPGRVRRRFSGERPPQLAMRTESSAASVAQIRREGSVMALIGVADGV